jgi:hypothetical protein
MKARMDWKGHNLLFYAFISKNTINLFNYLSFSDLDNVSVLRCASRIVWNLNQALLHLNTYSQGCALEVARTRMNMHLLMRKIETNYSAIA